MDAESLFKLLPCPHCGKEPRVYHGCSKGKLGDCVECDECDLENDDEGWEYVPWPDAVARWNEYVTKIQARLNAKESTMTIEELVTKYIAARDKRASIMEEAKSRCAKIDAVMEKIEAVLLKALEESQADSIKTKAGTAYKSIRTSCTVADWDTVLAFIQEHDLWHMLERRVSKASVDAYREEYDAIPPGLNIRSEVTVNIRRS